MPGISPPAESLAPPNALAFLPGGFGKSLTVSGAYLPAPDTAISPVGLLPAPGVFGSPL